MSNVSLNSPIVQSGFSSVVIQTFTSSGTYTPTTGMKQCQIECLGGGAGGGGVAGDGLYGLGGSGGGAGGYSRKISSSTAIGASQTVTIGTGGAGGIAGFNAGSAGGDTSVGSLCIAKGGSGGGAANNAGSTPAGLGGVSGTGDFTSTGAPGTVGYLTATAVTWAMSGSGGSSTYGGGGINSSTGATNNGSSATNYASGGSGAQSNFTAVNLAGGNGSPGVVIITEYI